MWDHGCFGIGRGCRKPKVAWWDDLFLVTEEQDGDKCTKTFASGRRENASGAVNSRV